MEIGEDYEDLTDEQFFSSFGRIVDRDAEGGAVLTPSRQRALATTVEALGGSPRRSVLLVGAPGVGKSTLTAEALRRLEGDDWVVFRASATEVLAGQMFVGMMEQRVREIAERAAGKRVVWLLPNFEESLWAGQHLQSPRGLLDAVLPQIEAGALTVVGEVDEAALERLVLRRPKVLELFELARLPPMQRDEALDVVRSWASAEGLDAPAAVLDEALDLAEQYLPALAAPGNALRLLKTVAAAETELRADTVTRSLSEMTGLPLRILDPRTPLTLADVRRFLTARVLGQDEAVECLVERIALIKSGLTDPTRPFGVYLFVGPTGTGKTELAKVLAEFVFGSADRLVRLDMSEFQTADSLERLLAETGADEAPSAGFVSAINRQPFSVVLLDEFEKAHANVWDVFLQVFDDGRLTTQSGRTTDFRQTVIILTSNIGSSLTGDAQVGFVPGGSAFSPAAVERAVAQYFRPEFLNRLDRVVVFRPLDREIMRSLLEKELTGVLRRRGFRLRPWAVEWDEAAVDLLIERGFSAELGARPLKRAIERHLLAPLAAAIVERQFPEGEQFLIVDARAGEIRVRFVDPDDGEGPTRRAPEPVPEPTLRAVALDPERTAAEVLFLRGELERIVARVEPFALQKERLLDETRDAAFWESGDRDRVLGLVEYFDRLAAATRTAERLAGRLQASSRGGRAPGAEVIQLLASRLHVLDSALGELASSEPRDALVAISPRADTGLSFAQSLADMYVAWAERRGMTARPSSAGPDDHVLGVRGLGAYAILRHEDGLHVLETPSGESSFDRAAVRVEVAPIDVATGRTLPADQRDAGRIVRRYRRSPSPLVRDESGWRTGRADRVLAGDFDLFT